MSPHDSREPIGPPKGPYFLVKMTRNGVFWLFSPAMESGSFLEFPLNWYTRLCKSVFHRPSAVLTHILIGHTIGLQKFSILALLGPLFGAKTSPFGGRGGPEEARYQVIVSDNHDSSPVRPICGSWDQIWSWGPSEDLWGPQKGL